MVICLESGTNDLHMVQLMPLPPHRLCFSKMQNGLSFWYRLTLQVVLEKAVKRVVVISLSLVVRNCGCILHELHEVFRMRRRPSIRIQWNCADWKDL